MDIKLEFEERDVLSFQDNSSIMDENEIDTDMNLRKNSILYSLDSINIQEKVNYFSNNKEENTFLYKRITLLEIKSDNQIENTIESIEFLYKEYKNFHLKIYSFLSLSEKLNNQKEKIIKIIIERITKQDYRDFYILESLIELISFINYKEKFIVAIMDVNNYHSIPEKAKENISTLINVISNEFIIFAENDILYSNEKHIFFSKIEENIKFSNLHHFDDIQCNEFMKKIEIGSYEDNLTDPFIYNMIRNEIINYEINKKLTLYDVSINCSILYVIIQGFVENYNYYNNEDNKINLKNLIRNGQILEIKGIKDEEIMNFRDSISNMSEIKSNSEILNSLLLKNKKYIEQFFINLNKDVSDPFIYNIIIFIEELNFEIKEKLLKNENLFLTNFENKLKYQVDNFFYQQNEIETSPAIDLNNLINSITYFF